MHLAYDPDDLLRNQMEVHGIQRVPPKNADDLMRSKTTVSDLCNFITRIGRLATRSGLPLELVFQCLLGISVGGEVNFDKQHRQGDVPMHQAKVLNRDAANSIAPQLRAEVSDAELDELVRRSTTMRTFLRVKVEDGNDLSMARRALALGEEYFKQIELLAASNATTMWALYSADDAATIRRIVEGGRSSSMNEGGEGTESKDQEELKPLPDNLVQGLERECAQALHKVTVPVPRRKEALTTVLRWIRSAPLQTVRHDIGPIYHAVRRGLEVHLAEARSALTRAACDVVSELAQLTEPSQFSLADVKDSVVAWMPILLKQVHVTVRAIAESTDATVRDLIIASEGATFICTAVCAALSKASQPELQRKCVGYLLMIIVASTADTATKIGIAQTSVDAMLRSGNDAIRRVARAFCIVCETRSPGFRFASWDDRCEKSAIDERGTILAILEKGMSAVEIGVLRYENPSRVKTAAPLASSNPMAETGYRGETPPSHPKGPLPALMNTAHAPSPVSSEASPMNLPSQSSQRPQPRATPVIPLDANTSRKDDVACHRPAPSRSIEPSPGAVRPGSGVPLSLANISTVPAMASPHRSESDLLSSLKAKLRRPAVGKS